MVDLPAEPEMRIRSQSSARWRRYGTQRLFSHLGLTAGFATHRRVESGAYNAMDQIALARAQRGRHHRHPALSSRLRTGTSLQDQAPCKTIVHHGAIATDDGGSGTWSSKGCS